MKRWMLLLTLVACGSSGPEPTDDEADADTDTDADTDADADADAPLRLFMASASDGAMGGVAGADTLCASDAANPDPGAQWRALLGSTGRVACDAPNCADGTGAQTDWVLQADTDYSLDGTTVLFTTDSNAIFTGTLTGPLDSGPYNYWTGIAADWTNFPDTCSDWTSTTGDGRVGWTESLEAGAWLDGGMLGCSGANRFLCVEQ